MENKDISKSQAGAIQNSLKLARRLQQDCPEIANLYRSGTYLPAIAESLDISLDYDVTAAVAENAIRFALGGYKGTKHFPYFPGLLNPNERKLLEKEHMSNHSLESVTLRRGIYGLSASFENFRNACSISR